jgi:signal peptidase II
MPVQGRKSQVAVLSLSVIAIIFLDQCLKYLVRQNLAVGQSIPVIKNILHITFVSNTGAAFGLFKKAALFFALISVVAVCFVLILLAKTIRRGELFKNLMLNFGLILVLSGAIGNLIDRALFLHVIDFIDFRIWPVFNIADSSITIGACLLIMSFLRNKPGQIDKRKGV